MISLDHERTERYSYDCMALRSPKTGPWLAAALPRPRVIGGSASPRSPEFFQKTSPVFKSFSKVYYARIVKSPLIPALQNTSPSVLDVKKTGPKRVKCGKMRFRQAPTCVLGGLGGSGGGCFLREGGDSRGAARLPYERGN